MEKRTYIQPEMEMAVMPKYALMEFQGSPGEQYNPIQHAPAPKMNPAPKRLTEIF